VRADDKYREEGRGDDREETEEESVEAFVKEFHCSLLYLTQLSVHQARKKPPKGLFVGQPTRRLITAI
jgi:hypothetical protein